MEIQRSEYKFVGCDHGRARCDLHAAGTPHHPHWCGGEYDTMSGRVRRFCRGVMGPAEVYESLVAIPGDGWVCARLRCTILTFAAPTVRDIQRELERLALRRVQREEDYCVQVDVDRVILGAGEGLKLAVFAGELAGVLVALKSCQFIGDHRRVADASEALRAAGVRYGWLYDPEPATATA